MTPTPLPWDDILVIEGSGISNEALAVAGNNVYVVSGETIRPVYLIRSTDGGHTFLPPVQIDPRGDTPSIARREGAGSDDADLYVTFDLERYIYFTRSTDGGATWLQPPVLVRESPDNGQLYDSKIAVDAQGIIYITWCHNHDGNGCALFLSRSVDGGATWLEPVQVAPGLRHLLSWDQACSLAVRDGNLYFAWGDSVAGEGRHILFTRSTDGGTTWSPPVPADDRPANVRYMGMVDLAVDPDGAIYVAWDDDRVDGVWNHTYVTRSTDGGVTWSPGVRVDDAQCLEANSVSGAITVGSTDVDQRDVLVALIDQRNYCGVGWLWGDVFLTRSRDGGRTWSPNEQLNDPIPYNIIWAHSIQTWGGTVYTLWRDEPAWDQPRVMLDIHAPVALPVLTATPTPTPLPTETATPTPSATPTASPSPTPSPTPTVSE